MTRLLLPLLAATLLAGPALAVGGNDTAPPKPTETASCAEGTIWDPDAKACVVPKDARLDGDALFRAARELAYLGRYADTLRVLDAMPDQADGRVLTYRGFVARKTGDLPRAMALYQAALEAEPDNLLARSYRGQGLVEAGDIAGARADLVAIWSFGGAGSWPEEALARAIAAGTGFAY